MSTETALASFRERNKQLWLSRHSSNKFWDITIVCRDGTEILCCRKDLCIMSEYFDRMFHGSFAESESWRITIDGVEGPILERMIGYFYEQRIDIKEEDLEAFAWAADKLLFPHVSAACLEFIDADVREENLTRYLSLLDQVPSLQASPTRANLITVLAEDIYFQLLPSEDGNDWRMKRCRLRSLSSESLLESLTHPSCPASERDKVVAIESWLAPIDADEGMPDEEGESCMPAPFFAAISLERMDLYDLNFLSSHRLVARSVDYVQGILREVLRRANFVRDGLELTKERLEHEQCALETTDANLSRRCLRHKWRDVSAEALESMYENLDHLEGRTIWKELFHSEGDTDVTICG